jgi:CubicO group peptidase (beta-lactamase class C family)
MSGYSTFYYFKLIVCIAILQLFFANGHAQQPKIQQIDSYLSRKIANGNIPGLAIAIVHYDTVLMAKGYGVDANQKALTTTSPFAIASLSKAFTATAVLQLAEAGKIVIDSPVINYIPSFLSSDPVGKKVTVRQLLHQIGGMADTGYPEFSLKTQPGDLNDVVKNLQSVKLVSAPGKAFHYHNPNYQVLAKIVENVSHEQFSAYLQKHILAPLHMGQTYNAENVRQFFNSKNRLPRGHIYVLGKPVATEEPDWFVSGPGGVVSTAGDMAKWLSSQLTTNRGTSAILGNKYMAMMQSPPAGTAFNYGMGWHVNAPAHVLYHSGIFWTYSSQQIILTDKGYGIVLLFNSGANPIVDYYSVLQGVEDILIGEKAEASNFPPWLYTAGIVCLLVVIFLLGIRRMLRVKRWYLNYEKRPDWKTWLYLFLRIAPVIMLLLTPYTVTILSGRVLPFGKIALMFMDVILVIGLLAFVNALIVVLRLIYLTRQIRHKSIATP